MRSANSSKDIALGVPYLSGEHGFSASLIASGGNIGFRVVLDLEASKCRQIVQRAQHPAAGSLPDFDLGYLGRASECSASDPEPMLRRTDRALS